MRMDMPNPAAAAPLLLLLLQFLLPSLQGVLSFTGDGTTPASSWWRSTIDHLAPPSSRDPHASDAFIGSPSILQVSDDRWLASHDRFFNEKVGTTYVFASQPGSGVDKWSPISKVSPMYWAQLFKAGSNIYIIGTSGDLSSSGDVVISRSINGTGSQWTTPVVVFKGSPTCHYHTAPTPAVILNDTVFKAFDQHDSTTGRMAVVMVKGDMSCRLLDDPSCWSLSGNINFDPRWIPGVSRLKLPLVSQSWEEPGAIVTGVDAKSVSVMVRIDNSSCASIADCNRAVLLQYNAATNALEFDAVVSFPSGCNKFAVRRGNDGMYYTLSNPVIHADPLACMERNELVLARSSDLKSWHTCAAVMWDDTGLSASDSIQSTGLQYVDWRFSGEDIIAAVRAGYRGAVTYHDANNLLCTNVSSYQRLCSGPQVQGEGFVLASMHRGLPAFSNRAYLWDTVPPLLEGLMFSKRAGGVVARMRVVAPADSANTTIYAAVCTQQPGHDPAKFSAWTPVYPEGEANLSYDNGTKLSLFSRPLVGGASVDVPEDATWCGTIVLVGPQYPLRL